MLWTQDRLRSTCRGMVKGMGYFIRTEIKNHMCQARFFVGLLVLFAAAVISEHFHVQVLVDNGSSTEDRAGLRHILIIFTVTAFFCFFR